MSQLVLDRRSRIPAYEQLFNHFREAIRSGELKPGTRLPSVLNMVSTYSVSSATVQKAIQRLKAERLVVGQQGKAVVVVREPPPARDKESASELWVESLDWLEGDEVRFLNRFQALYPHLTIAKRPMGNDVSLLTMDYLPKAVEVLEDVTELTLELYGRSEQGAEMFERLLVNGRLYMLPLKINVPVIACNVSVFETMGVELPGPDWDWDEFLRVGRALTRKEEGRYGFAATVDMWDSFVPCVWQAGGALFERDGSRCRLNSGPAIEAGRFLRAWREISAPIRAVSAWDAFIDGKVGITSVGVVGYRTLNSKGCRWVARPLPKGREKVSPLTAAGYGLSRRSAHRGPGIDFLKERAGYEVWPENRNLPSALPLHRCLEREGENERTYRSELSHSRTLLYDIEPECRQQVHRLVLQLINSHYLASLIFGDKPVEQILGEITEESNYLITVASSNFAWT